MVVRCCAGEIRKKFCQNRLADGILRPCFPGEPGCCERLFFIRITQKHTCRFGQYDRVRHPSTVRGNIHANAQIPHRRSDLLAADRAALPACPGSCLHCPVSAGAVRRRHRRLHGRAVAGVRTPERPDRLLPDAGALCLAGQVVPGHRHCRGGVHHSVHRQRLHPGAPRLRPHAPGRFEHRHRGGGHGQLHPAHQPDRPDAGASVSAGAGHGRFAGLAGASPQGRQDQLEAPGHPVRGQLALRRPDLVHWLFQPRPHQAQGHLRLGMAGDLL